jgi:hypothetical protein
MSARVRTISFNMPSYMALSCRMWRRIRSSSAIAPAIRAKTRVTTPARPLRGIEIQNGCVAAISDAVVTMRVADVLGARRRQERGLIASERAGSGHRRYSRAVLRRIAFIVFAQRIGLTLDEIGAELIQGASRPRANPPRLVSSHAHVDRRPG